jgi:hypothetical protein
MSEPATSGSPPGWMDTATSNSEAPCREMTKPLTSGSPGGSDARTPENCVS